jgi:hypothetical protein
MRRAGKPYVYGAAGPDSFDCSGLIVYALNQIGIDTGGRLNSDSLMSWSGTRNVNVSTGKATRGAILHAPDHVAVSLGDGRIVEAPIEGVPVRIVADYGGPNGGWNSAAIVTALTTNPTPVAQEDDMFIIKSANRPHALVGPGLFHVFSGTEELQVTLNVFSPIIKDKVNDREYDVAKAVITTANQAK